jgi:hypothetical protein
MNTDTFPIELSKLPALSIRQPWAWFILNAGKRHENRDWSPHHPGRRFRGEFLIHAARGCTGLEYDEAVGFARIGCGVTPGRVPRKEELPRGGVVGMARVVDFLEPGRGGICYNALPWFTGPGALVLEDVRALPFYPCRGALGFFRVARVNARGGTGTRGEML